MTQMDRPNYITPAGYAALRAEYDALFMVERPRLVETISWAAGNGDRSENGDYIYGRRRLREIDRTLDRLSRKMKAAKVVDPARQPECGTRTRGDRAHAAFRPGLPLAARRRSRRGYTRRALPS